MDVDGGMDAWDDWLDSAPGRYLLHWEQAQLDAAVADVFGFHALQCVLRQLDALRANRMPNRMAARLGHWKAVRLNLAATPNGPIELYDLATDPGEKHDVAQQQPALVARFAQIFAQAHMPSPVFKFQPKKANEE